MKLNQNPEEQYRSETIDRILSGLNSAEPPTGMEQRILEAVELQGIAASAGSAPRFAWLRTLRIGQSLGFASALALLILSFVQLFRPHFPVNVLPANIANEKAAPFNGPSLRIDTRSAETIGEMPKPVLNLAGVPLPNPKPKTPKREATQPVYFLIAALTVPPPVTTTQASAPPASFPAPPMPLTQQERLMLRIAHRNDPQTLDALIPEKRAAREAQDNSEFENFFPPPKPVEYPALLLSQVNQPAVPHGDK